MRAPTRGPVARTSAQFGALLALGTLLVLTIWSPDLTAAAPARQSDQEAALHELAVRLLAPPPPVPGVQPQTIELFPAALPPDLALDLPVPPGGRLIGSARFTRPDGTSTVAILDAPLSAQETFAYYQRELPGRGWASSGPRPRPGGGGFAATSSPVGGYFCQGAADPWLDVNAYARDAQTSDVRVAWTATPSGSPCNPQVPPGPARPPVPPTLPEMLPLLSPPPGLDVRLAGGQAGSDRWSAQVAIETDKSPAELEAHYAGQLEAAGWTRRAGDAQSAFAWSTWDVPREGTWRGVLYVAEGAGQNRRTANLQLETVGPPPFAPPLGPAPVPPPLPPAPVVPVSPGR